MASRSASPQAVCSPCCTCAAFLELLTNLLFWLLPSCSSCINVVTLFRAAGRFLVLYRLLTFRKYCFTCGDTPLVQVYVFSDTHNLLPSMDDLTFLLCCFSAVTRAATLFPGSRLCACVDGRVLFNHPELFTCFLIAYLERANLSSCCFVAAKSFCR